MAFLSGRKWEKGTTGRGTVYVEVKVLRKWLEQVRICETYIGKGVCRKAWGMRNNCIQKNQMVKKVM